MSILTAELIEYLSANMPESDTTTSGGAIDTAAKPDLTQWASNNIAQVVSDGTDTRTVTVTGRLATGVIDSEVLTLNGTTPVSGAKTWERILKIVLSAASGTRTVQVKEGAGGTVRATFVPNDVTKRTMFYDSASGSGITIRYEKIFWKNTNGTLTLTDSTITLTADPAARVRVGCDTAVDATTSVANRLTAPSSVVFVDDSVAQGVPGGNIAAGSRIGVWIELNLPANDPATKSTYTTQLAGSTT